MPNWDLVQTAFLVAIAVALPLLFAAFIFWQIVLAQTRAFVTEVLASEVVQALAGAAAIVGSKGGQPVGNVKTVIASKGMDLIGRLMERFGL